MSRFKMMTRTTIVFPIRSVRTRTVNIAVILICADSESVYSDIVGTIFLYVINKQYYYMEESVLLGTKPLVDSIRHFIRDPSGVFSVCHLCECRIVQLRYDSHLLLLLNWFLHIIKRTLHIGSKI